MEEIELPVQKVDIIISEWMGYFLLYESMLDSVIWARDHYLVPGGLILPDYVSLSMVAIEDSEYKKEKFEFWNNVYGVNMGCIKDIAMSEPLVDYVEKKLVRSVPFKFFELDLYKAKVSDLSFAHKYKLQITQNDNIHALVCWFDAYFTRLENPINLSTSVFSTATHWKQTVFYLHEPIKVQKGKFLEGSIAVKRSIKNFRDLDIKISFHYDDGTTKADACHMYKLG